MAYIIKTIAGEVVDGGQTRDQVIRALQNHGFISFRESAPDWKLPRFGKALVLSNPLPLPSCIIEHL